MTATMKAVVLTGYGEPQDVLRLDTIARPTPTRDQVLVRVRAAAVNDWDWCFARGKPRIYRLLFGLTRPKVTVLGVDVSGVVEAVGEGVHSLAVGDEVYGDLSEAGFGGFAEYVCCRQDAWTKKPSRMTFEEAAALPHASLLALQGLVDIGQIQHGERVLINGAGGGVGVIGLQIAKRHGAEVTGVDSAFKLKALSALGFDHVIDYQAHDFTSDGQRYDLILDTKTTRSPFRYLRSLTPKGRYVTVGGDAARLLQTALAAPLVRTSLIRASQTKQVHVLALKPNQGMATINEMFETWGLQCLIDGTYTLADLPRALQRFGAAEHIGKILISVSA